MSSSPREAPSPEEIEAEYRRHPFIREIGVLRDDDRLVAVVVPDPEGLQQGSESRVEEALRQAVMLRGHELSADRQLDDHVVSPTGLPRTDGGRLDRRALRERYERLRRGHPPEDQPERTLPPEEMRPEDRRLLASDATVRTLWRWLDARFEKRALTPDTRFQVDLGVDSLEWANLAFELGSDRDIYLNEEQIARVTTVRDLLREVHEAGPGRPERHGSPLREPERVLTPQQKRWLEAPSWPLRALGRAMFAVDWLLMKGVFNLSVRGRENLPASDPFVVVPNHCSYLDPPVVFAALPYRRQKNTHWIAWRKIVRLNALTHLAHRAGGGLPVDSIDAAISSLAYGAAALKRGRNLVWFPEGRRSPNGRLQPFQPGLGLLLEVYDHVAVVPASIRGTFEAWPAGRRWPRPRPIRVRFGRPAHPDELAREGRGENVPARILDGLYERLASMGIRGEKTVAGGDA